MELSTGHIVSAWLIAIVTSILTVWIHYESLVLLRRWVVRFKERARVFVTLVCLIVTHIVEIYVFAIVYGLMSLDPQFGTIVDLESATDFVYYSSVVYTTVGFGDLYPTGPIRVVTAIEAIVGLVLITWSATFMFVGGREENE